MKLKRRIINISIYFILALAAIVTLFPVLYTVAASFKSNMELLTNPGSFFPDNPTLENYKIAFSSENFHVPTLMRNSILYTVANVAVNVSISAMAGYVFARGHFRFKKIIFACFSALMFVKTGGMDIYPTFEILDALNLTAGLASLVLVHCFSIPVVNIYLVKGNIESLPLELDEAAKMDGYSFIGIFFKIILPLLKPILTTVAIMSFKASWNEYLMPNIFTMLRPKEKTLVVGLMALKNSGEAAAAWNLMLAGSVIAMLPILVVFAIGNKYFIKGIAAGAVKG